MRKSVFCWVLVGTSLGASLVHGTDHHYEVWRSTANNLELATRVGDWIESTQFLDTTALPETSYNYWNHRIHAPPSTMFSASFRSCLAVLLVARSSSGIGRVALVTRSITLVRLTGAFPGTSSTDRPAGRNRASYHRRGTYSDTRDWDNSAR